MASLEETIKQDWRSYTPSEQKLASFFLNNLRELPFETAASIGQQVRVSPMTVGRYVRKLGYADLRELKNDLRASADGWDEAKFIGPAFVPASLKAKVKGLASVYRIAETPEWPRIVARLASASVVHVASFQLGRFMGQGFADALHSLRPRVYFADGGDGAYADVLLDSDRDAVLVLIDMRRYSRHFRLLAEEAVARDIPLVILTDVYCHWARTLTDNVVMIETDFGIRSLSMAQLLFELLLADVAAELNGAAERIEEIHLLRERFVGVVGSQSPRRKSGEP